MKCRTVSNLLSALEVSRGDLVSLVGGGGKTTAMYRLTHELRQVGIQAACATTTKIGPPEEADGARLLCAEDWQELRAAVQLWDWESSSPVLGTRILSPVKVAGIPPEWCDRLLAEGLVGALIVEADGAARKPVKAPETWEPVVPLGTTIFVAVVGLSCAGQPLGEDIAFRTERISRVTGLLPGSPLTPAALAVLLTSPEGLLKGKPPAARTALLLNQADLPGAREIGRGIAADALTRSTDLDRVVIAALKQPDQTVEVFEH